MSEKLRNIFGLGNASMGRKQFGINMAIVFALGVVYAIIIDGSDGIFPALFEIIIILVALDIYISSAIRRSRDAGWGRMWWLSLVPLANFIYILALVIKPANSMTEAQLLH